MDLIWGGVGEKQQMVQGDAKSSHMFYDRALKIARSAFQPDDLSLVNVEVGHAAVLKQQERYDEALKLYNHALKVRPRCVCLCQIMCATEHHKKLTFVGTFIVSIFPSFLF